MSNTLYLARIKHVHPISLLTGQTTSHHFAEWFYSEKKFKQPQFDELVKIGLEKCLRRLKNPQEVTQNLSEILKKDEFFYLGRAVDINDDLSGESKILVPDNITIPKEFMSSLKVRYSIENKGREYQIRYYRDAIRTSEFIPYVEIKTFLDRAADAFLKIIS